MRAAPELHADTTLPDARESYAYWRTRRARLPWHRRGARREARTMAARWRARLIRAHLERVGLDTTGVIVERLIGVLGRSRRDHARWLWRTAGLGVLRTNRKLWLITTVAIAAMATVGVLAIYAASALLF